MLRIALAGNPNCGKTTIFNSLTGLRHKVANYPGVTVEKKEGVSSLPELGEVTFIDLPGIYSLSAHSVDETIASKALLGTLKNNGGKVEARLDLLVSVVDASNLERNLYLTSQLIDLGVPIIIALNMRDVAELRGISIKSELLARAIDVPIVFMTAKKKPGISELQIEIVKLLKSPRLPKTSYDWLPADSLYADIASRLGELELGHKGSAAILLGSALLSEASIPDNAEVTKRRPEMRAELQKLSVDPFSFEATARYGWINSIVKQSVTFTDPNKKFLSDKIDRVILHPLWGSVIFLGIMTLIFQSIFLWASVPMDLIDGLFGSLSNTVGLFLPNGMLKSLIVNGIIPGVGSVLIFVPQIAILFFFLGCLEDSGYLSRAAFLMDKIMRRCGLQGRSFIPLLSSFACAIPGIMSTRSIPSFADRMTTIMVAPLMSCSARLPVYTLLIAGFIPQKYYLGFISLQGLVLLSMYLLGVAAAALIAWLLKFSLFRGEPALFVMEMPPFRMPVFKGVFRDIFDRIVLFLKSAGTVILACSIALWFLASYPQGKIENSYAGRIGAAMEPVIKPLGFNWEIGIGILASFAAREVFVSSLATVYNIAESEEGDDESKQRGLISVLKEKRASGNFTTLTALSLMIFYVFACQCMSTLAICRRETGSWKWTGVMFAYMTALAYGASLLTYQLGMRILGHG